MLFENSPSAQIFPAYSVPPPILPLAPPPVSVADVMNRPRKRIPKRPFNTTLEPKMAQEAPRRYATIANYNLSTGRHSLSRIREMPSIRKAFIQKRKQNDNSTKKY
ncbi:uncharacterized protein LOC123007297 [Tribolium madens]|uniref:uncharacterized protein LOC123007297 n=1 Tax=Tribolium madens TaxID=41895 RepID=UPI001CF73339|nr:uncharacterized protein LOC123007297 [Tribolium madens]